jgi:hypothetical protein
MRKAAFAALTLVVLAGCSYLYTESLRGNMRRLGNNRYGYHLFIPAKWKHSPNSEIRPTEVRVLSRDTDAGIIIEVKEGGAVPDLREHVEGLKRQEEKEAFALLWKKYQTFEDVPGYAFSISWRGTLSISGYKCGKPAVEYQATVTVVDRDPSPIVLICYAPKEKFDGLSTEFFWHARESLKVIPIELTVREATEEK